MRTTVTAVLVAKNGGDWLDQTITGLREQTRAPDRIVALVTDGAEGAAAQLAAAGVSHIVTTPGSLAFGAAISRAVATLAPLADTAEASEWFWLLTEDSAPEPSALEHILTTVQRSPSVAIAGPKLVNWDHPERIIELGQSLTQNGDRWLLRRQELDQQQYDHLDDVLGVGPVGMLVRRDVWSQLGGFDPALAVYDDGLDLSVRARLAGYRVVVAPASRVRFAQLGIGGPRVDRSRRVLRQMHTQGRTAQLHRKISYAPAFFAFCMWLLLPLVAVGRVAWALVRENPGFMVGECVASLRVFFQPASLIASRRRLRANQVVTWAALRSLQVDTKTVRTTRMIDREAILAAQGRLPREIHFVSSGGLAVVGTAAVLGIVLTWWALSSNSLMGAALMPLSDFTVLWDHTRTLDGVPADPFAWVLAILGSVTFWNPSLAVVLVLVLALPLAALGGWVWGAQLTESPAARALIGMGWALSPVLLGTLESGRLPTILLAVVLPWLLLAATRCRESWSWAGTASLLAGIALACAPVLIPAALVFLVIGVFTSVRGITRVLSIALAPLVLFAPKLIAVVGNDPLTLLLDPGVTPAYEPAAPWHMLLGFADQGLQPWGEMFVAWGWNGFPVSLIASITLLPVVLLAVLGAVTAKIRTTLLHAALGGAGFLTAVAAGQISLLSDGNDPVLIWTGSGVLLFWIALLGLAGLGVSVIRKGAIALVSLAIIGLLLLSGPLALRLAAGQGSVQSAEQQMPAIVQASGSLDAQHITLVVSALDEYRLNVTAVEGAGQRLDDIRTVTQAAPQLDEQQAVADLVAKLTSAGDAETLRSELEQAGVRFVLLSDIGSRIERAYLQAAFDQQPALSNAGVTEQGVLWRVTGSETEPMAAPEENFAAQLDGSSLGGQLVWVVQLVFLLGLVLLALPTGEVSERAERRRSSSKAVKPRERHKADRQQITSEQAAAETSEIGGEQQPETHSEIAPAADSETQVTESDTK